MVMKYLDKRCSEMRCYFYAQNKSKLRGINKGAGARCTGADELRAGAGAGAGQNEEQEQEQGKTVGGGGSPQGTVRRGRRRR